MLKLSSPLASIKCPRSPPNWNGSSVKSTFTGRCTNGSGTNTKRPGWRPAKLNIVRLIDPPVVPDRPLPRRLLLNVVLAAFVGAFLAVMFAFVAEFLRTHAHDDRAVEELPFLALFRNKRHDGNGLLAPSRGAAARK